MFDDTHNLELSGKDLELIESALHTQQKILSLQGKAGSAEARSRLTDLRNLMKRIGRKTPAAPAASEVIPAQFAGTLCGWFRSSAAR